MGMRLALYDVLCAEFECEIFTCGMVCVCLLSLKSVMMGLFGVCERERLCTDLLCIRVRSCS